jgi:ArsR family transcriptional regulator, cadmium/lead-responsive transcriptional repressor
MAMIAAREGIERLELVPAATLFRSLGDLSRLAIVRRLAEGPARVTDLVTALGLAQSTVSKHLACLRESMSRVSWNLGDDPW